MRVTVSGIFAAVATPVDVHGRPDLAAFDRLVDFLVDAGLDGICVGGATGEYPHFEVAERQALVRRAASRLPSDRILLAGIGGAPVARALELGRSALESGARALLLPMPSFFRYEQHDLAAFARHVASTLRAPCLLYDLPGFTNPIATTTAIDLMASEPYVVGIKDSSGRAERLGTFVAARGDGPWSLIVGDDALLARGVEAGWNGGISGLASFCPELIAALYRSMRAGDREEAGRCEALVAELIEQVAALPVPWGVRLGLAARGLDTGAMPLPLSESRRAQIARYQAWLPGWIERGIPGSPKFEV
jgi:4-hydroxy-tetrahydrodipicolinate synthase